MWGQFALAVLQQLPSILQFAESLVPGAGKGTEKKLTVASEMVKYEGALALDQRVKTAKSALIDAQVAYVNAMEAAAIEAQHLGIVVGPLTTSSLGSPAGSGSAVASGAAALSRPSA